MSGQITEKKTASFVGIQIPNALVQRILFLERPSNDPKNVPSEIESGVILLCFVLRHKIQLNQLTSEAQQFKCYIFFCSANQPK